MNKYAKKFFHRGLMFGGFGSIVVGVVYAILELTLPSVSLGGFEVLLATVSSYLLAFVQAGATVFNQIEHWSVPKSLFWHFISLYVAYVGCYLANTWIPFRVDVVLIFTAIFVVLFFAIWFTVYLCVRATSKKMNARLS